jgi:hypothetical protein
MMSRRFHSGGFTTGCYPRAFSRVRLVKLRRVFEAKGVCMLPGKDDRRWFTILTDATPPPVEGLATKMLLMRVKQMVRFNPNGLNEAVDVAHEFFCRHEAVCRKDIMILFGSEKP